MRREGQRFLGDLNNDGGERRQGAVGLQSAVENFAGKKVRGAGEFAGLIAKVDGAADEFASEGAVEGNDGAFAGSGLFSDIENGAGALHEGAIFFAQGDQFLKELIPVVAGFEGAVEQVAFELDAFLAVFASIGGENASAFVAGLAAGVDGGAVESSKFLASEEEGEGAGGEEGECVHGEEATGAKAIEAAAFVVVVGVAGGEAGASETWRGFFVLHEDVRSGGGDSSILPSIQNGVKAVVVLGVFGEAEDGISGVIHGVGVLAEFVKVVVVGGVHTAREKVGVVVEAVAFGHEEEIPFGVSSAEDGESFVPKGFVVDEVGHVEAEAVDAVKGAVFIGTQDGEPVIVDGDHGGAEGGLGVVELGGVGPVAIEEGGAIGGFDVVFGVLRNPHMVAGGVVGGDVENNFEIQGVSTVNESEDFGFGAVFGFDGGKIAGGVGRADAFAGEVSDRIRREQIEGVEAEAAEAGKIFGQIGQRGIRKGFFGDGFDGVAGFAGGQRAEVDLINDCGGEPRGVCFHGCAL